MSVIEPPLEWLVAALESRDPEVRFQAVNGLRRRGDRAAAEALINVLRARFQCQADFYVALRALREGYSGVFRERMTRCTESDLGHLHHEFYLGRWEVRRQFPEPAFPSGAGNGAHTLGGKRGVEAPNGGPRGS